MMKHSYIRSFHASHHLNLTTMDNEREYLPWMSDLYPHNSFNVYSVQACTDEYKQVSQAVVV
jgi:hypothetical protein